MFTDALNIVPSKRNILKVIASTNYPIGFSQPTWMIDSMFLSCNVRVSE